MCSFVRFQAAEDDSQEAESLEVIENEYWEVWNFNFGVCASLFHARAASLFALNYVWFTIFQEWINLHSQIHFYVLYCTLGLPPALFPLCFFRETFIFCCLSTWIRIHWKLLCYIYYCTECLSTEESERITFPLAYYLLVHNNVDSSLLYSKPHSQHQNTIPPLHSGLSNDTALWL